MSSALHIAYANLTSASVNLFHHAHAAGPPSPRVREAAEEVESALHRLYLELSEAAVRRDAPSRGEDAGAAQVAL